MAVGMDFKQRLFDEGWLHETGVLGVYALGEAFDSIVSAVDAWLRAWEGAEGALHVIFPPEMKRSDVDRFGYRRNFPHLLGDVGVLACQEAGVLRPDDASGCSAVCDCSSGLVLTPAACYPVYPLAANKKVSPGSPLKYALKSYCFRAEPSSEISRFQAFRMREFVMIGTGQEVRDFQRGGLQYVTRVATELKLKFNITVANDPFFGEAAAIKADYQRHIEAKFELVVELPRVGVVACASCNYHQDHFTRECSIANTEGQLLESACVAFGLERISLALLATHGFDLKLWPLSVREILAL